MVKNEKKQDAVGGFLTVLGYYEEREKEKQNAGAALAVSAE